MPEQQEEEARRGSDSAIRFVSSPIRRGIPRAVACTLALLASFGAGPALAQVDGSILPGSGLSTSAGGVDLRLKIEAKFGLRHSREEEFPIETFLAPDPVSQGFFTLRTPDPGTSLEVSHVALVADADMPPDIHARVRVHFIDLYNRNPTSSEGIEVREAWARFGQNFESLQPIPGSSFSVLAGRAPRLSRQAARRLESYGLWGTAAGRFEEDQIQIGASLGSNFYLRGSIGNGNPVFLRDPNALAGDNGTPGRTIGNVDPIYGSGFPILYDTLPTDVNFDDRFELGGGAGARWLDESGADGIDLFGWYFQREMDDSVPIRGVFYGGDMDLLSLGPDEVPDIPLLALPTNGRRKWEAGLNLEGRVKRLHLFAQIVYQSIAGLERLGPEAEVAYRFRFEDGLVRWREIPVFGWIEPVFRFSHLESRFRSPPDFPAPSLAWDWRKYDIGVRAGIVRGVDLTVEYSRSEAMPAGGPDFHPDEFLATLRVGI